MIAAQEELDWECYRLYGLIDEDLTLPRRRCPAIALGERAFEIVLARRVAAGEEETAWFARHGSTPDHRDPGALAARTTGDLVQRRLDADRVRSGRSGCWSGRSTSGGGRRSRGRRWRPGRSRDWLLDRLEEPSLWSDASGPRVLSIGAARRRGRAATRTWSRRLALLTGRAGPRPAPRSSASWSRIEAVPYLAALPLHGLRAAQAGGVGAACGTLQRREDAGEKVGTIPVPPKYTNKRLPQGVVLAGPRQARRAQGAVHLLPGRGAVGGSARLVLGWAGWDHAEQARALARLIVERVSAEGWGADRLTPLLAGLVELEPWLLQWHDEPVPGFQASPAQAIRGLLDAAARRAVADPRGRHPLAPPGTGARPGKGTALSAGAPMSPTLPNHTRVMLVELARTQVNRTNVVRFDCLAAQRTTRRTHGPWSPHARSGVPAVGSSDLGALEPLGRPSAAGGVRGDLARHLVRGGSPLHGDRGQHARAQAGGAAAQ